MSDALPNAFDVLPRLIKTSCLICRHPILAMSERAMKDAGRAHAAYIAETCDQATDPHLEDVRLHRLL